MGCGAERGFFGEEHAALFFFHRYCEFWFLARKNRMLALSGTSGGRDHQLSEDQGGRTAEILFEGKAELIGLQDFRQG